MKKKGNIFQSVLLPKVQQSRFDLSHDIKTSFQMGELIPTCCMEVLPGDKFTISIENMLRFAPLIAPVMHRVRVATHYFFVPNRILWPQWDEWITGNLDVAAPKMTIATGNQFAKGSVPDYLGYPATDPMAVDTPMSPFPIAAYRMIWDEYYRDQNLQTAQFVPLIPGENVAYGIANDVTPYRRAWQHDYFTSCLPWAQKGDSVQIPLVDQGTIPVTPDAVNGGDPKVIHMALNTPAHAGDINSGNDGIVPNALRDASGDNITFDFNGSQVVDIQADATDINTLRRAFRLQEWLERNARAGTRYVENILAHFGIKGSDARLQRPEYIGGSKQNMVISEVLSTAQNDDASVPVGQMAGHGISVGGGNTFSYSAEEHGWLIGIISVIPDTAYAQGLPRSYSRFDRLDYAWPTFANIGEQPVTVRELYAHAPTPDATFGYIPRYAEYKYGISKVSAEMRDTLLYWHLGRIFDATPALNEAFISCTPRNDIFAVTDPSNDHIFAHIFNNISAVRKLPRFGIPTI